MSMSTQRLITSAYTAGLIDSYQMHLLCAAINLEPEDLESFFSAAMQKEPRR